MKVTITEAHRLARTPGVLIRWRPDVSLPESQQYAVITKPR